MTIYIPVIFVSVLYYAIGIIMNKENAKYLLSGYNTMSDEERKKFEPFHVFKCFCNYPVRYGTEKLKLQCEM